MPASPSSRTSTLTRRPLLAVLEEIDAWAPDAIWCLGDVVGYGPAPNRCCQVVAERADVCLIGNHDLVALGTLDVEDFNDEAAAAALWTRAALDERSRAFLSELEPSAAVGDVAALPREPARPGLGVRAQRRDGVRQPA